MSESNADDAVPLHQIQAIVTPDKFEYGVHRMRVPGGWIYWLQPAGSTISALVPDPAIAMPLQPFDGGGSPQPVDPPQPAPTPAPPSPSPSNGGGDQSGSGGSDETC